MKKNIFLLFVIITVSSVAQVSGYMGKRFSIGYSNYFSPRIPLANSLVSEFHSEISDANIATSNSFNYTNSIDADYILTSTVSLCVSGQFSKMDFCEYGSKFSLKEYSNGSFDYPLIYYSPPKGKSMDLRTTNVSIGFKFFNKRYHNPFGTYSKVEFTLVTDKVIMDKDEFYNQTSSLYAEKYNVPDAAYAYKSFVLAYTLGKQRILFDKIVLDYGLRMGLNYSYILTQGNVIAKIADLQNEDENKDITLDYRLKRIANVRVFQSQLLNAHIGLRFLAF